MKVYWNDTERKLVVNAILKKWPGAVMATKEMINEAQRDALPEYRWRDVKVARTPWLDEALVKASAPPPPPPEPEPEPPVQTMAPEVESGSLHSGPFGPFDPVSRPFVAFPQAYMDILSKSLDAHLEYNATLAKIADSLATIAASLSKTVATEPVPAPHDIPLLPPIDVFKSNPPIQQEVTHVAQPSETAPVIKKRIAPLPAVLIVGINSKISEQHIRHRLQGKVGRLEFMYKAHMGYLRDNVTNSYGMHGQKFSLVVFTTGAEKQVFKTAQEQLLTSLTMWVDGSAEKIADHLAGALPHYADIVHCIPQDQI